MNRNDLARDAVMINGLYLEDIIEGYHTLRASGRETLTKEINVNTYRRNGSTKDYTRFSQREIEVEYVISGKSPEDFRDKVTQLMGLLNVEEVDIQFNDEEDKFYIGDISVNTPSEKQGLFYVGTYTIICENPFKYSVDVKTVSPSETKDNTATFVIDYNGTYPSRPVLQAEFTGAKSGGNYSDDGDCGYIAFTDERENIIQLGNPNALDLDSSSTAAQLINRVFSSIDDFTTTGTIAANTSISDTYWNKGTGQTLVFAKPTGTASLSYAVDGGAQNFNLAMVQRMCSNANSQTGTFYCYCYDANNNIVAGILINKNSNGTTAKVSYIVNGQTRKTQNIDISYYNTNYGYCNRTQAYKKVGTKYYWNKKKKKWQTSKIKKAKTKIVYKNVKNGYNYTQSNLNTTISKNGDSISFKVGNAAVVSFTDSDTTTIPSTKIEIGFSGNLHTNAINSLKFTRNAGASFTDNSNIFTAGDVVEADCNDASVYIKRTGTEDGQFAPEYGALGNDWEEFILEPGINYINCNWSGWVKAGYEPTVKIIYNEVFI